MDSLEFRLLNEFQRNWPLVPQPYGLVGEKLGTGESWVLERLAAFQRDGVISRVGAVFAPGTIGASTLAALEVPPQRLKAVADIVSGFPEVNHNYEREHRINLWFVVTAPSEERLGQVLADIETEAQCGALLALRLTEEFRIDLGFDLRVNPAGAELAVPQPVRAPHTLTAQERRLVSALQEGLPLAPYPFAALGDATGIGEAQVLELHPPVDRGRLGPAAGCDRAPSRTGLSRQRDGGVGRAGHAGAAAGNQSGAAGWRHIVLPTCAGATALGLQPLLHDPRQEP